MSNEQEWVQRWEDREVEFRKIVAESKTSYVERVNLLSKTLSEKQAVILTIRELPFVGPRLIRWAEKKTARG